MLDNIFITGTANELIAQLGNNTTILGKNFYNLSILSQKTDSSHHSQNNKTSHLTTYSASLVYTIARSHIEETSTILICVRIPAILPFNTDNNIALENIFDTEWFFNIDLVRHAIILLTQEKASNNLSDTRRRIIICMPKLNLKKLNVSQLVYYNSLYSALKTLSSLDSNEYEIAILFYENSQTIEKTADFILSTLDNLQNTNIHKKIINEDNGIKKLVQKLKSR